MWQLLDDTAIEDVTIIVDDVAHSVPAKISVAAAMLLTANQDLRLTAVSGSPRAPYCMMGVCFDCLLQIDGIANQRACMTKVQDNMQIRRQNAVTRLQDEP